MRFLSMECKKCLCWLYRQLVHRCFLRRFNHTVQNRGRKDGYLGVAPARRPNISEHLRDQVIFHRRAVIRILAQREEIVLTPPTAATTTAAAAAAAT